VLLADVDKSAYHQQSQNGTNHISAVRSKMVGSGAWSAKDDGLTVVASRRLLAGREACHKEHLPE
jgi:hypothetical protein